MQQASPYVYSIAQELCMGGPIFLVSTWFHSLHRENLISVKTTGGTAKVWERMELAQLPHLPQWDTEEHGKCNDTRRLFSVCSHGRWDTCKSYLLLPWSRVMARVVILWCSPMGERTVKGECQGSAWHPLSTSVTQCAGVH
jgi:hypothetical protein